MNETMRIAKFLSHAGVASRREAERIVDSGVVSINGQIVDDKAVKVVVGKDVVFVNHMKVDLPVNGGIYLMLNKPVNVVSTTDDEQDRETVLDIVLTHKELDPRIKNGGVWPVGRLDLDSRGLMLLTNDGELTHRLTHPKWHVNKRYEVKVAGELLPWKLQKLRDGVYLSDGQTSEAKVEILRGRDDAEGKRLHVLEFVLQEGRHRQIRRMCGAVKLEVVDLCRVAIGNVVLGALEEREIRVLDEEEVMGLKALVGL